MYCLVPFHLPMLVSFVFHVSYKNKQFRDITTKGVNLRVYYRTNPNFQIGFAVTKKSAAGSDWKKALGCVWIFLLYYVALLVGTLYNVVKIMKGDLSEIQMSAQVSASLP